MRADSCQPEKNIAFLKYLSCFSFSFRNYFYLCGRLHINVINHKTPNIAGQYMLWSNRQANLQQTETDQRGICKYLRDWVVCSTIWWKYWHYSAETDKTQCFAIGNVVEKSDQSCTLEPRTLRNITKECCAVS